MTRCVFLTHSAADSGAEQSLVTTLSLWPSDEEVPLLVLAEEGPIADKARARSISTLVCPLDVGAGSLRREEAGVRRALSGLMSLVRVAPAMRRVLRAQNADVVVAFSIKSLVYGLLAGRWAGAKVVWSVHDRVSADYFPRAFVPVLRYVVPRLVDAVTVNSRSTLDTLRPGRTPTLVATPAITLDGRTFDPPGHPLRTIVMLGRLAPWKAQDNFLRAFAQVFAGSPVRALVVGGPLFGEHAYEASLRKLALELGLVDQVVFTGHVDDPWSYLLHADVLVHCSRSPEPFGQVVVQGMWARCAVVASSPGGPAEVITDDEDGLLVPCGDVAALAGALRRLRDETGLASRLAGAARETASAYDGEPGAAGLASWLTALHRGDLEARQVHSSQVEQ
jgi:glycosyltransferase involved in cell wall biosynthesis